MDFSKVNFEGVFIGAIAGLFLKGLFDRLLTARKLNRNRKIVVEFCTHIGLDKSLKYVEDLRFVRDSIQANTEESIKELESRNYAVDAMPMFSSDLLKSFSKSELRQASFNTKNFITILDITYSIDFLREYMPLTLWTNYQQKFRQHMDEKQIDDEIKHMQECGELQHMAKEAVIEIGAKETRAIEIHKQLHLLIKNLSGNGFFWTIKYLLKQ